MLEELKVSPHTHPNRAAESMAWAKVEIERLRYVLGGVRGAIATGRNEPLQVWLDQINIALEEE